MSFTPQIGQKVEGEDLKKYQTVRKTVAEDATPKQKGSFVMRAANKIVDFAGTRGIADQYGASLARLNLRLKGDKEAAALVENPDPQKVYGSAIQSGAMLLPTGAGASLATKVGLGATAGQMVGVGADLQSGKSPEEAFALQGEALFGAAMPVAGAAIKSLASVFNKTGQKIQFSVIKPSQADIKDGFKIETVKKYDLGGSLAKSYEKTQSKLQELSNQLNTKLSGATETVDLDSVYKKTVQDLLGDKAKTFGSNSQLGGILDDLREEVIAVSNNVPVDVITANEVKRASGHFGAWQFGNTDPTANAREKVYNQFYRNLKESIEQASPEGVKEINKQMSEIIPVMNALIRRIPVAERNNLISLSDILTFTATSINPTIGALTLANLASKSGTFGNAMSRIGSKIQNIPDAGVSNILTKTGAQAVNSEEN